MAFLGKALRSFSQTDGPTAEAQVSTQNTDKARYPAENRPAISQNPADNSERRIILAKDLNALIRTSNDIGQLKDIKDKAEALPI